VSFPESQNPQPTGVTIVTQGERISGVLSRKAQTTLLGAICACVLVGILGAGLWPFHAPRNEVNWSSQGNGLLFGKNGSIVSAGAFEAIPSRADSSCSLEIWVQPSRSRSSGTILAFYWPTRRIVPFALRQSLGDLKLESGNQDHFAKNAKIYIDDVFSRLKPVFVTISSDQTGTSIYVDGTLVKKSTTFRFSSQDLTGQLLLGNAPSTTHNWSGQVKALAVYDRELSAAEVSQHFADWTKGKQPDLAEGGVVASYLFNEGKGNVIHNQADSATDLLIPERFFVLHEQFLERPWTEYRSEWNYWEDVGVNITGFIPLGFFFVAYFSAIRGVKRATWFTIALGFSVSLTIEVLQAFLPTRNSGITDLITNTLGTSLGATLCVWSIKHNWLAQAGFSPVLPMEEEETVFSSASS
jgi:VanZ family protein